MGSTRFGWLLILQLLSSKRQCHASSMSHFSKVNLKSLRTLGVRLHKKGANCQFQDQHVYRSLAMEQRLPHYPGQHCQGRSIGKCTFGGSADSDHRVKGTEITLSALGEKTEPGGRPRRSPHHVYKCGVPALLVLTACFCDTLFGCFLIGWLTRHFPQDAPFWDRRSCAILFWALD